MIFYRINSTPPRIVGTQADARREAREANVAWEQIDVPTDKTALMAYVNELLFASGSADRAAEAALNAALDAEQVRHSYPANTVAQIRDFTADEIEDFLLNRATVTQVGNIFECLGTRFAEQRAAA